MKQLAIFPNILFSKTNSPLIGLLFIIFPEVNCIFFKQKILFEIKPYIIKLFSFNS